MENGLDYRHLTECETNGTDGTPHLAQFMLKKCVSRRRKNPGGGAPSLYGGVEFGMFCNLTMESRVSHPVYVGLSLLRQNRRSWRKALTLIELLLVVSIMGTLGAVAVPLYTNHMHTIRMSEAIAGLREIESKIAAFKAERGVYPDTLADVGVTSNSDPWGYAYEYLRREGVDKHDVEGKWRKYHGEVPINSDFDLYSMGKDGISKAPLTASDSRDDVVRANDGTY